MTSSVGGVILCGGQSRRMGRDKARLPVGSQSMLARTVQTMSQTVAPLVVVAAADQSLPSDLGGHSMPDDLGEIILVRDREPGQGPLEALAVGLHALQGRAKAAYVTGVDVPLLRPQFIAAVSRRLGDRHQVVLPCDAQHHYPLAAVYRLSLLPVLEELLAAGERRPAALFAAVSTLRIDVEQLREADPELLSLVNCNRPEDYRAAIERLGLDNEEEE